MATIASLLRERGLAPGQFGRSDLLGGVYIPRLQSEGQVVRFLLDRGFPIPSRSRRWRRSAMAYVRAVERFAGRYRIP